MSAEIYNKESKYLFDIISVILIKNNCFIKDIDLESGMFQIDGKNQQSILKCEDDISFAFSKMYERALNANSLWRQC